MDGIFIKRGSIKIKDDGKILKTSKIERQKEEEKSCSKEMIK